MCFSRLLVFPCQPLIKYASHMTIINIYCILSKFVEDMQMYVAGCLYKSTGLKVAIAGSFIIGSLIVGPFSTMKAICDGFSCVSFVYFAFASICIIIFRFLGKGFFENAP